MAASALSKCLKQDCLAAEGRRNPSRGSSSRGTLGGIFCGGSHIGHSRKALSRSGCVGSLQAEAGCPVLENRLPLGVRVEAQWTSIPPSTLQSFCNGQVSFRKGLGKFLTPRAT